MISLATQASGIHAGFDKLNQRSLAELVEARVRWLSLSKPVSVG